MQRITENRKSGYAFGAAPLSALVFCLLLSPSGPSAAQSFTEGECDLYAARAVEQNRQNIAQGCGLSGLRWHSRTDSHKRFCLAVRKGVAQAEYNTRKRQLDQCASNAGSGNRPSYGNSTANSKTPVCKAAYAIEFTSTRRVMTTSRRNQAIRAWNQGVEERHGSRFANFAIAGDRSLGCSFARDENNNFLCTIRGRPCDRPGG